MYRQSGTCDRIVRERYRRSLLIRRAVVAWSAGACASQVRDHRRIELNGPHHKAVIGPSLWCADRIQSFVEEGARRNRVQLVLNRYRKVLGFGDKDIERVTNCKAFSSF